MLLGWPADNLAKTYGDLSLLLAALRIFFIVVSECFIHPDARDGLPGVSNILYSE